LIIELLHKIEAGLDVVDINEKLAARKAFSEIIVKSAGNTWRVVSPIIE